MVLSELLTVAGGPLMWEVLQRSMTIYEKYRNQQLQNIQECFVVNDIAGEKTQQGKKETTLNKKTSATSGPNSEATKQSRGLAQKELEAHQEAWNKTIKLMSDSLKLEEVETTFTDGTKRKIWKVNRPKPEAIETVDFLQLLPSWIGKMILAYLPRSQLADYSRVNKYWAYLIDDLKAEFSARLKIDTDLEKLQEIMLRHDTSMEVIAQTDFQVINPSSRPNSVAPSVRKTLPSLKVSEKSVGAYSFKHFVTEKLIKPPVKTAQIPIRNMREYVERLERRGAADENIWNWCRNVLNQTRVGKKKTTKPPEEGILLLGSTHFPCPLLPQNVKIPLQKPLSTDPTTSKLVNPKRNISNATVMNFPKEQNMKRYHLWSRDFSSLYRVFKIPSYQSPI